MSNVPTKAGFYWARWKINDGTIDKMFDTSGANSLWEVVEVYWRDNLDREDAFFVWLMGVPGTQPIDNFFWGPGPLEAPPHRRIDGEREKQRAARLNYQHMSPDEREEWLQAQRRKL